MDIQPKALPHVVTGLIAKRAEIAGQIEALQKEIRSKSADIVHIDAAIRIFAEDICHPFLSPHEDFYRLTASTRF
jgi:hypothetical protein